jgi:hypothetical protein
MTLVLAVTLASMVALAPRMAAAEGLFDFLFGNAPKQQAPQTSFFADPFGANPPPPASTPAPRPVSSSRYSSYCVRTCDGKYFPLVARGGSSPAQMCQTFCPASEIKIYSGSSIDNAVSAAGERYADSSNAYAYRKAFKAGCTCNGRDPAGLAQIDLSTDPSLRAGDVIATSKGLVAYSGVRVGIDQAAEFTPVADYPGLTSEVRARLGEMKVAPVSADMIADDVASPAANRDVSLSPAPASKSASPRAIRTSVD